METYDEKSVLPMLNGTLPTINQDGVIASVSHSGQIMIEHSPENVIDPQETSFLPIFTPDFDTKEREKEQSSNHSEGYIRRALIINGKQDGSPEMKRWEHA